MWIERQSETDLVPEIAKKRPRGRAWTQGVNGNPAGRPKGAQNQFTRAVAEGICRAEAKLAQAQVIDRERPYECWDGYLIQKGVWFVWDPIFKYYVALPDQDPPLKPPARFDPGGRRTEMTWRGREIYVQYGWPFDPATWKRLRL